MACANRQSEVAPCPPSIEFGRYVGASASVLLATNGVDVAVTPVNEGGDVMSRAKVGMVIEELLSDENLRIRFALDRIGAVVDLFRRGFDLSPDEIDLFYRTDACLWFLADIARGEQPQ
jgi:hypothetical protein